MKTDLRVQREAIKDSTGDPNVTNVTGNPMTGILSKGEVDGRQNGEATQETSVNQRLDWSGVGTAFCNSKLLADREDSSDKWVIVLRPAQGTNSSEACIKPTEL